MKNWKRRNFLKKLLMGGMVLSGSGQLLANPNHQSTTEEDQKSAEKENDIFKIPFKNDKNLAEKDWKTITQAFPFTSWASYLNTGSLGPSLIFVLNKIREHQNLLFRKNVYRSARYDRAKENIAAFVGATLDEIAVTRNATEGMNLIANEVRLKKGDEVIISSHEHIGGAGPWIGLKNRKGIKIKVVNLDLTGNDNYNRIIGAISKKTKLIAISHVTCTTGLVLPVQKIIEACRQRNIMSCIDGAQALGMFPVNLGALQPDFYVASGHKWCFGPRGTGILYVNKNSMNKLEPSFYGAYVDEYYNLEKAEFKARSTAERFEYGTRNLANIIGLSEAFTFITNVGHDRISQRGLELHHYLISKLKTNKEIEVISPETPEFQSSIVAFRLKNEEQTKKVYQSLVDSQLKVRYVYEHQLNAIRISCSFANLESDLDNLMDYLP